MIAFLLRLLGARFDDSAAVRLGGATLRWRNGDAFGWLLLLFLALVAATWWLYRRSAGHLSRGRRRLLVALRAGLLAALLGILLRPVLVLAVEGTVRRRLVCLVDTSASMRIADPRLDEDDVKRAAIAGGLLDPRKGLSQPLDAARAAQVRQVPRVDLLRGVLGNADLALLTRLGRDYDFVAYGFGGDLRELGNATAPEDKADPKAAPAWLASLDTQARATALGDAIRGVLGRQRGQPLAGILLCTDGANNSGSPPAAAAEIARAEGVPLYVYGVGITSPRDIIVSNLFTPEVAFARDAVNVTVRVRGQGLKGQSAELLLRLGDDVVARHAVTFGGDEEQVVALNFKPSHAGEFPLTAAIAPRPDEAVQDNNATTQRLRVIDQKIRVLFVERAPRWEFRYLQALLLRDPRLDLQCVLVEGDPGIARGKDSPYLERVPTRKEELFQYDLIILGDVDPATFAPAGLETLGEYVSKFGGSLLCLAGRSFLPAAYRRTALEKLLPIELPEVATAGPPGPASDPASGNAGARPGTLELTTAGRASKMLALAAPDAENLAAWKRLPPLFWTARVARAKPAAEVLLVDPDPLKLSRGEKMPVLALQQYGLGQVLFAGSDNFWRWRREGGERAYHAFWGQIVQRLALAHLLGASRRTQLSADKTHYATGDRVTVFARLYKENYEPVTDAAMRAGYTVKGGSNADAERRDVPLRALPEQPGMYRGEFVALRPGVLEISSETDPKTTLEITVTEPQFEPGDTAMNEPLLRELAKTSGGAFFREEDLYRLPDVVERKTERVRSSVEVELGSSPLVFALLLALAAAEWTLRRRSELR